MTHALLTRCALRLTHVAAATILIHLSAYAPAAAVDSFSFDAYGAFENGGKLALSAQQLSSPKVTFPPAVSGVTFSTITLQTQAAAGTAVVSEDHTTVSYQANQPVSGAAFTDSFTVVGEYSDQSGSATVTVVVHDFAAAQGSYTLDTDAFYTVPNVTSANRGAQYHGALTLNASGMLTCHSGILTARGQMDGAGIFRWTSSPPTGAPGGGFQTAAAVQLNLSNGLFTLQGAIASGLPGAQITYQLSGTHVVPSASGAAEYTMALFPASGAADSLPQGIGWAKVLIRKTGFISLFGMLNDGLRFSSSSGLQADQAFVFSQYIGSRYWNLAGAKYDAIYGSVSLAPAAPASHSGTLAFTGAGGVSGGYAQGFNETVTAEFSPFTNATLKSPLFPEGSAFEFVATGADSVTEAVQLGRNQEPYRLVTPTSEIRSLVFHLADDAKGRPNRRVIQRIVSIPGECLEERLV